MKTVKLEQGSPAWLDFRLNGVGASEIASIASIPGAFQKRTEVLQEKATGARRELTSFQKKLFADGHEWEALVRDTLNAGGNANFVPEVAVSEENPRLFASLDGYDSELGMVLEVKSCSTPEKFREYCERTPAHYEAQVQWQLFITGAKGATLAFVHDGQVVKKYIVANEDIQHRLHACAIEFLQELDAIKVGTRVAPVQTLDSPVMTRITMLKKTREDMKIQMAMVEEELNSLAEKLMGETKATRLENAEIVISYLERQGTIDYKRIPEIKNLGESYLNAFRGKGSKSIQVKLK